MAVKNITKDSDVQPPQKRQKTSLASSSKLQAQTPTKRQTLHAIQSLESDLSSALASSSSLNALVDLQSIASTSGQDPETVSKAIYALYRVYTQIISKGLLEKSKAGDGVSEKDAEERNIVRTWLLENIGEFAELLGGLLKDEESHLRTSALQILFTILKQLSSPANPPKPSGDAGESTPPPSTLFDGPFFHKIVLALLSSPASTRHSPEDNDNGESEAFNGLIDNDVCDNFTRTWLNKYADVRWYFLREIITIISSSDLLSSNPTIPANALSILEKLEGMPTKDSDINTFWLEGFGIKASKSSKSARHSGLDTDEESDIGEEEDDWRTFFDDPQPSSTSSSQTQSKKKRIHKMSVAEQIRSVASHRAVFTRCWVTLLPLLSNPLPKSTIEKKIAGKNDIKKRKSEKQASRGKEVPDTTSLTTRALTVLHRGVMPHLTRAVLVMDWVAGCVDQGGVVGMLALNALFLLMKDYNLDYTQFYTRLYAFLDRDVLHAKHRSRFFRLLELFLSSSHLPVTLLASFIKRLAQLSLSAPPAAIVLIIPFTYNVLKRHPALMVMIHNPNPTEQNDPFLPDATNPQQTHALESSLWELYSHTRHYHHSISVLARVFEGAFTKPQYGMEDFLDHSYASLFETESSRKIKPNMTVPVIEPEVAKLRKLVITRREDEANTDGGDCISAIEGVDIVSSLWSF